jgi:hypothetical protein
VAVGLIRQRTETIDPSPIACYEPEGGAVAKGGKQPGSGRPKLAKDQATVPINCVGPQSLRDRVDAYQAARGLSTRNEAIRELLDDALTAYESGSDLHSNDS